MSRDAGNGLQPSAVSSAAPYQPPYITGRTIRSIPRRPKPLPPRANAEATPCKLFQLEEHVEFRCFKCKKDFIRADAVAVDEISGLLMCQQCYSRAVRPKEFRPTRLVPFPSLMSWLTYKRPTTVQTTVSTDVNARPAEAALPSGRRVAMPEMITAGTTPAAALQSLPATPLNPLGSALDAGTRLLLESSSSEAAREALSKLGVHPCVVNYGGCQHGQLCFFSRAPTNLCLPFLMGVCTDASRCGREHQPVFDLPPSQPYPPRAPAGADAAWESWVAARRSSSNQKEWQLWNQAWSMQLAETYVPQPEPPRPIVTDAAAAGGLNLSAIRSALSSLKKPPPAS